jgi:hypothetical protein
MKGCKCNFIGADAQLIRCCQRILRKISHQSISYSANGLYTKTISCNKKNPKQKNNKTKYNILFIFQVLDMGAFGIEQFFHDYDKKIGKC